MKKASNDNRIKITQMLIRKAFTELLAEKPLQSISIKELCDHAGIHRSTFYTHYKDIYDLKKQLEDEMLQDFLEVLSPLISSQESAAFNPVEISTEIFQCLKDNSDICIMTLSEYGDKSFAEKLINIGREKCMSAYSKYFQGATRQQIEYYYAYTCAGCIGLLRKWLDEGMQASAAEIARTAESLMMNGIGFLKNEPLPLTTPPDTPK